MTRLYADAIVFCIRDEHPWILVSTRILEPVPHRYKGQHYTRFPYIYISMMKFNLSVTVRD